jgi:hypothetical protein
LGGSSNARTRRNGHVTEDCNGLSRTGKAKTANDGCSTDRQNALFHSYDSIRKKVVARPKRILEMPIDATTAQTGISICLYRCADELRVICCELVTIK